MRFICLKGTGGYPESEDSEGMQFRNHKLKEQEEHKERRQDSECIVCSASAHAPQALSRAVA
jgi:hypothetical protein